jgi:hypothetical protein
MDEDLLLALELSAVEARKTLDKPLVLLDHDKSIKRSSLPPPLSHHFNNRNGLVEDGVLKNIGGLNQFHSAFVPLIEKYGTTSSICGYITAANVVALRSAAHKGLSAMIDACRDFELIYSLVEKFMDALRKSRLKYIESHREEFEGGTGGKAALNFCRNWVRRSFIVNYIFTVSYFYDGHCIFCTIITL